jgi:hypothetical protein
VEMLRQPRHVLLNKLPVLIHNTDIRFNLTEQKKMPETHDRYVIK